MAKEIFYRRVGRRYEPVSAYDSAHMDSLPQGCHLVIIDKGWHSRRHNINPNRAALAAAAVCMEGRLARIIQQATEIRPEKEPLTDEQRLAWKRLAESFDQDNIMLAWPSARQAAEEILAELMADAERLMANPMVKQAYDEFVATCRLTVDSDQDKHI